MNKKINDSELKEIVGGCSLTEFLGEKMLGDLRVSLPEIRHEFSCSDDVPDDGGEDNNPDDPTGGV